MSPVRQMSSALHLPRVARPQLTNAHLLSVLIRPSLSLLFVLKVLAKVGNTPAEFKLYQHKRGQQPILISPDDVVNLREPGVERFTTMPKDTTEGREGPCLRQSLRLPAANEEYVNGLGLHGKRCATATLSG